MSLIFLKFLKILLVSVALKIFLLTSFASSSDVFIPNYWDQFERFSKPDTGNIGRLRFLTTTDFPPFNFVDGKKRLSGFHVDLTRAICAELELLNRCEIQALPWDELMEAIEKEQGEALIAGHQVNQANREKLTFSRPYLRIPARFMVRKNSGLNGSAYEALFRKNTAVVEGSAQQAYFKSVFAARKSVPFPNREEALAALSSGAVDAVFADALSLSYWLKSKNAKDCCMFLDGAYDSRKFFGNGMSIAVSRLRPELADAINFALANINRNGVFTELYLRYFPVSLY